MAQRPPSIANALARAVAAAQLEATDVACIALAKQLAAICDASSAQLVEHGPKLLAVLVELKLTPKARSAVIAGGGTPGVSVDPRRAALTVLRQRGAGEN